MGERRPEPPAANPPRPASRSGLSPVQQAYGEYVRHALYCRSCRDVDAGPCVTADGLWRAYRQVYEAAYDALANEQG